MSAPLDNVRELRATILELAPEIEEMRSLPKSLLDALKLAGVVHMYVPKSHGGDELPPSEVIKVIEEIARADASVGWLSAIAANGPALLAFLPPDTYDAIYAKGPDVIQAGSLVPRGRAVPVDGGFHFSGKWPFASGCMHADYFSFAAIVQRDGVDPGDGPPEVRFGVAPADQLEIVDTWHVSGLRGTGSHDFQATDLFVPVEWTGTFTSPAPVIRHPLDSRAPLARLGVELAAVALGNAQGALDDLVEIGLTKKPLGGMMKPLAKDPAFHFKLGRLDLELRAARILLHDIARSDFDRVTRGENLNQRELFERVTMLAYVGELCTRVVNGCYHESGTTGLFEQSALQRRLRDAHAIVQHFILSRDATSNGALLLGEPVAGPGF